VQETSAPDAWAAISNKNAKEPRLKNIALSSVLAPIAEPPTKRKLNSFREGVVGNSGTPAAGVEKITPRALGVGADLRLPRGRPSRLDASVLAVRFRNLPYETVRRCTMRCSVSAFAERLTPQVFDSEGVERPVVMVPYRPFYRDYTEWNHTENRVENRLDRKHEQARDEDCEELFDAAIRHRFGVFISRAKLEFMHAAPSTAHRSSRRG
jgi:hypothetical protein